MAQASTVPFSGFKALLESATLPNTFVAPCGLTSRSLKLVKETNDTTVPDCENEDAAAWTERDVVAKSATVSGEGVMARESLKRWRDAFESDDPVKVRIEIAGTAAQGGGHWIGLFHLTNYELGGTKGERCNVSVELVSTGPVLFVPAV